MVVDENIFIWKVKEVKETSAGTKFCRLTKAERNINITNLAISCWWLCENPAVPLVSSLVSLITGFSLHLCWANYFSFSLYHTSLEACWRIITTLVEDNHFIYGRMVPLTICWCSMLHPHAAPQADNIQSECPFVFCSLQPGREGHEAAVEIPGQDEVSEETLHHPLPRLPHHIPPLPQPLHWGWLRAGK